MYTLKLSILNVDEAADPNLKAAAFDYIEKLKTVSDLQTQVPTQKIQGTRGDLSLLNDIVIIGVNIGAFAAIYTLAKDMISLYLNADVQLKFEDGSSITLKNLTEKEAENKIKQHLERQGTESAN